MRRPITVLVAAIVLVSVVPGGVIAQQGDQSAVDCEFPVTATDVTGETVTVEQEPQRVVVLQASAAQTMWEIEAEEKVVGMPVNQYTSYLPGSGERTNVVGEDLKPINEKVVALQPDLVLAPNIIGNKTVKQFREAGLTVYKFREAKSLDRVYEKTKLTGRLVGAFPAAAQRTAEMKGTVGAVREAVEGEQRPKVLYLFGSSGFTAGPDTFIGELIATAGGNNIADAANISRYGRISPEVIAKQDPDYIVIPEPRSLPKNDAINESTAVQEGQVVRVNDNYLNQPAPRIVIPLKTMAQAFHPDAYAQANVDDPEIPSAQQCAAVATATPTATPTPTETPTATAVDGRSPDTAADERTMSPTPTETGTVTTAGADGPGYTVVTALIAVLATAALAVRRRQ